MKVRAHATQIAYRVAGGSRRTPTWTSNAVFQEVTLSASRSAVAGQPLTLVADTSAMPLLEGRVLTLQQRIGASWTTITTSSVGPDGRGSFLVEPTGAGQAVYRVRAEDWDRGVGHVGWFPSYPLYVDVAAAGSTSNRLPTSARQRSLAPTLTKAPPHQVTAAGSRRWGIQRYDFDWEYGESLTDRAVIGSNRRGQWLDTSTGTGRVMMRNGAMQLSSNSEGAGRAGSTGSLSATLQGNVQPYGRWETRAMPMVFAGGSTDYVLRAELLPQADLATGCDSRSISLFETRPSTPGVTIGAHAPGGVSWQRTLDVTTQRTFHAYAVEVSPKKITWFVDGRPVGRVTDAAAISGQPLTVRITMAASGNEQMRTTRTLVDWVRAYSPDKGIPTRGGTRMSAGSYAPTC